MSATNGGPVSGTAAHLMSARPIVSQGPDILARYLTEYGDWGGFHGYRCPGHWLDPDNPRNHRLQTAGDVDYRRKWNSHWPHCSECYPLGRARQLWRRVHDLEVAA